MRILAIDKALNGAWSLFDSRTSRLLEHGWFSFDVKKYTFPEAVLEIEKLVANLIKQYKVKYVAIEDIQLRLNAQSFKKLAQLQGVLVNLCEKHKLHYGLVAPTRWQAYCKNYYTENGQERKFANTKELSISYVKDVFDIDTANDNLADAICICQYTLMHQELIFGEASENIHNQTKELKEN